MKLLETDVNNIILLMSIKGLCECISEFEVEGEHLLDPNRISRMIYLEHNSHEHRLILSLRRQMQGANRKRQKAMAISATRQIRIHLDKIISGQEARMLPYCCAKFQIWGQEIEPDIVTKEMRLPPDRARRVGQSRLRRHNGKVICDFREVYKEGHWWMMSKKWVEGSTLANPYDHMDWILHQLENRREPLAKIIENYPNTRLLCEARWQEHDKVELHNSLHERAEALGLEISIEPYDVLEIEAVEDVT